MKVTRILHAKRPNKGKVAALREQARRLGLVRTEVWQRFGSVGGVGVSDRQIRDGWLKEGRAFPVSANAWKETLRDARGDIRIATPLNTTVEPTGTLRIIIKNDDRIEIHTTIEIETKQDCGDRTVGVDKGYSEVLVDSDGEHHGQELGRVLTDQSDKLKAKYQHRSKLRALANNTRNPLKREHIHRFNLGRKKLDRQMDKTHARIRATVFQSVHKVVDKAAVIAAEDLTAPMAGKSFGKNVNRRLASWTKGVIAEALDSVSSRRGSTVVLVNPAYTSQMDSRNGGLLGKRQGDRFYCFDGVVLQADQNAARNVLARLSDPDIERFMPYRQVKAILQARTERLRLGLLNQDSSCSPEHDRVLSTESESLKNHHEQLCLSF